MRSGKSRPATPRSSRPLYIPILALAGIEGKMLHPMALTVMLALGGALLLAVTLRPVLCSFLLRGPVPEGDNPIIRLAQRLHEPSLRTALRLRWLVVIAALLISAGSAWLFTRLGSQFVPTLDEGSIPYTFPKPVDEWPKTTGRPRDKAELREQIEVALKLINPDYNILAQPIEMRFNGLKAPRPSSR